MPDTVVYEKIDEIPAPNGVRARNRALGQKLTAATNSWRDLDIDRIDLEEVEDGSLTWAAYHRVVRST